MTNAPYMYWVGVDLPADATPDEERAFDDFYSNVHAPEVVEMNPGFIRGTRYELAIPDPRGDLGPRHVAMYEMESEDAARGYIRRNDDPSQARPQYTPGPRGFREMRGMWRLLWHRVAPPDGELTAAAAPYIWLIGMNVPPGTDEVGLQQFNDFYTNVHIPEVVAMGGFARGSRYELYRQFRHPDSGAPRFLAIYEGDEAALQALTERRAGAGSRPALSSGPPSWEAHDTRWRLWYRRTSSYQKQR